jgi:hypothetical protein
MLMRTWQMVMGLTGLIISCAATPALAGSAKGTISYQSNTASVQHAYLVKGPDAVDEKKIIRRLILAPKDLEATIKACRAMSCSDGNVGEGMTIDLDGGPRVNYWVVLKGQLVQFSGTADPSTFKTKTDEPGHLAGSFTVDATASGGPKIAVDFDAALLKEFQAAR